MDKNEYKKMEDLQKTNWWYRSRRYLIKKLWKKYIGCGNFQTLDVGCGVGEAISIATGVVDGIDDSVEAINIASLKGYRQIKMGSAEKLPFQSNSYDNVLILDVLEHIEDDKEVLRECNRVLKQNGKMILSVPAHKYLWSGHDEVFGHKRRYSKKDLQTKIEQANFKILKISFFYFSIFPFVFAYRLMEKVIRNKRSSHFFEIPSFINSSLETLMKIEANIVSLGINLPLGSSIIVVAVKK